MFSVVIPTLGRHTLERTLQSIISQAGRNEIIIVVDSFEMPIAEIFRIQRIAERYYARFAAIDAGYRGLGNPQNDWGHRLATHPWVLNIGDDDVYEPGAFELMAHAISRQWTSNPHPLLFQAILHPALHRGDQREPVLLWEERRLARGCITGQNFCIPNNKAKMGLWSNDWQFFLQTARIYGDQVDWVEEVTVQCY